MKLGVSEVSVGLEGLENDVVLEDDQAYVVEYARKPDWDDSEDALDFFCLLYGAEFPWVGR